MGLFLLPDEVRNLFLKFQNSPRVSIPASMNDKTLAQTKHLKEEKR